MPDDGTMEDFWKERQEKAGGKVQFQTFATFIGRSQDKRLDLGGLAYIINNIVYFEDFEKDNFFFKIISKRKNYTKTEFSFPVSSVQSVKEVSLGEGVNCITGIIKDTDTKGINPVVRFFSNPILQISMEGGYSYFFDIMRRKEFIEIIRQ